MRALAPIVLLIALAACGSHGSSSTPTPVPVGVAITPSDDFLLVGEAVQFSAAVTLSDGSSSSQPGTWGSDTPGVATVDATGRVTGVGAGKATIYVDVQGHRGTRLLTVIPSYKGQWSGAVVLDTCTDSGALHASGFCKAVAPGDREPLELDVVQTRTILSGTITLGGYGGPFTGTVADDGAMGLTTTVSAEGFLVTVKDWKVRSAQPGVLTGSFGLTWTIPGASGTGVWSVHLDGMHRVSGGSAAAP